MDLTTNTCPHRRQNLLTGEWILVSPHRTQRPWQGKVESVPGNSRPAYDPKCYLCPGNSRAGEARNPHYTSTFVFDNDFAALLPDPAEASKESHALLISGPVTGKCRVICFSPRHNLTLPQMSIEEISGVIEVWADQVADLGRTWKWVQVFENKGEVMGCSNPHPHGQVWASDMIPNEPSKEDLHLKRYLEQKGRNLLMEYTELESRLGERTVAENEHWLAVIPYWALWPFETLLLPKRQVLRLPDINPDERLSLASILKRLLTRYDNLFETSFPYSMGWHGAPTMEGQFDHWQLHAHFYPPLLRSASVKKFMVGYEMLSEPQRDLTAETAAERLRAVSERHYLEEVRESR